VYICFWYTSSQNQDFDGSETSLVMQTEHDLVSKPKKLVYLSGTMLFVDLDLFKKHVNDF
jgi:hypothetical protein